MSIEFRSQEVGAGQRSSPAHLMSGLSGLFTRSWPPFRVIPSHACTTQDLFVGFSVDGQLVFVIGQVFHFISRATVDILVLVFQVLFCFCRTTDLKDVSSEWFKF